MNPIYIGVDFHSRQQTICYLKTETGELVIADLKHRDKEQLRAFYQQFQGQVIIGLEASGYSPWFETLLEGLGCEVWLGDATEIRRRARWRQKSDRRDAELIWDLMVHNEFPLLHRPALPSREILRMLRYRHKLVKVRTLIKNSLQSLSIQAGLSLQARLFTRQGTQQLEALALSPVMGQQRQQWLELLQELNHHITETEGWLKQQALSDPRISRLRTHPGLGLLSALGIVHTLIPVSRFSTTRKVAAYGGFDPMERSSADKKRYLGISKAGSRLLRFLLIEATQTAVKTDPDLQRFYRRLVQRRGKPKAKVAVARKLLIRSFIMLRDEINYAEFQQRAIAARLAREFARPNVPVPLIGQPASPAKG